jgi:hypothetical protein
LFNAISAIVQLYHGENKLIFNEMMMMRLDFNCPSSLKQQSADRHVAPLGHNILIPSQPVSLALPGHIVEHVEKVEHINREHMFKISHQRSTLFLSSEAAASKKRLVQNTMLY